MSGGKRGRRLLSFSEGLPLRIRVRLNPFHRRVLRLSIYYDFNEIQVLGYLSFTAKLTLHSK